MKIGIVGLGKMGSELCRQGLEKGLSIAGLTQGQPPRDLVTKGMKSVKDLTELKRELKSPRIIFLYVPAGQVVEEIIHQCARLLDEGDVLVDGGNSYWGDSARRHSILKDSGIHFLDMGTSGGIFGARNGACFMVGGEKRIFDLVEPILKVLAAEDAVTFVGPAGSGHLVKLIHNGIEFGMLQAIGEGISLLERYRKDLGLNMEEVFRAYRNGSVIRSWLVDLMHEQYKEKGGTKKVPAYVEDTGEVNWLLEDAIHLEVPIPIISQSIMELFRSRDEARTDYKAVAMMRHGFGMHPYGPTPLFKFSRQSSRVRADFPDDHLHKLRNEQ